jgi:hypothetical protein
MWFINQSNAIGWAASSDDFDRTWPHRTRQWARTAPYAGRPALPYAVGNRALDYDATVNAPLTGTTASLALAVARIYYAQVDNSRPILIVPSASGSTGFVDNRWNPGDTLYETELARLNAAMATHPDNQLVLIYSASGENEAGDPPTPPDTHATLLDRMIQDIRARATGGATAPFLVAGMVPAWVASETDWPSAQKRAVQDDLIDTPNRQPYTAYVDPEASPAQGAGDNVHYSAVDYRGADGLGGMALKAVQAIALAQANTP